MVLNIRVEAVVLHIFTASLVITLELPLQTPVIVTTGLGLVIVFCSALSEELAVS